MVMKDKLVKTNHKGPYYVMKQISIIFLAIASAAFIIAIPTYIIQNSKKQKTPMIAEENSSEVESNNGEEIVSYESYDD